MGVLNEANKLLNHNNVSGTNAHLVDIEQNLQALVSLQVKMIKLLETSVLIQTGKTLEEAERIAYSEHLSE